MPLSKEPGADKSVKSGEPEIATISVAGLKDASSHNIVSIPTPKSHVVNEFVPGKLNDNKGIRYSEVQKTFKSNEMKASRFQLSELTLGPLAVNDELEERVQVEVERRLEVELAVLREKIAKEAFDTGQAAGRKEAHEMVFQNAKPLVEKFEKLVNEIESLKEEVAKANEDFIVQLVYKLAKLVTLKEIKEDRQYITRLLASLIERVGVRENIKIYVNAEDYSAAEQIKADLAQKLGTLKNISIEPEAEGQDRGCRIETDFGEIDAKIETQLKNIESTFG